jgi:peptidoglycan/xylan/chitin deacetylase (PgdA/CDA1 family)
LGIIKAIGKGTKTLYRVSSNLFDTPAVVLIYHRVATIDHDPRLLSVEPDNFARNLEHLKTHYRLIDIEEFVFRKKHGKRFPEKSVLLTFDDGYSDNLHEALPILEAHDAAAIFFISTFWIDHQREYWWDEIERIFSEEHHLPGRLDVEINDRKTTFHLTSKAERFNAYEKFRRLMRQSHAGDQSRLMNQLIRWSGLSEQARDSHRPMTGDEIARLDRSKSAVIGAHAHTHTQLSLYTPEEQLTEIKQSRDILEKIIERPVTLFAYPFGGKADYNRDSIRICRELGFDLCFSNFCFQIHRWTDPFQVPRMLVRNWDIETFKSRIDRFFKY